MRRILLILAAGILGGGWPAQAQEPTLVQDGRPAVAVGDRGVYVIEKGHIYRFVETLGQPASIGEYGPQVKARGDR